MVTTATKPDSAEVARRGNEIYETAIKPLLDAEDIGKPLIIETTTGEYEILPDDSAVAERLHALGPSTTRFMMRIGYPAMYKKGGGWGPHTPRL